MTTPVQLDEARLRETVRRLQAVYTEDHERGCDGRCYSCSCGYDTKNETAAQEGALAILALLDALSAERDRGDRAVGRPVHVVRVEGADLEEWRKNVVRTETYKRGDTVLAWVNEGDLYVNPACKFEPPLATQKAEGT